ncbi:phage-related DNA recombination protein [Burkholderia sp. TJI49]|nr:phage-related DNA recombination protein [Burkholderia sp. TJI49]
MSNALIAVTNEIYGVRENFERVAVDRSINFDREAGFAVQILQGNPYLLGVAEKDRASMIAAVTNVSAIGISLNPAKKQAYLVPRGGKVCLDISYMGLLDLAIASGSIQWGQAEVVCEEDTFTLRGFDKAPLHDFAPFSKTRGAVVGVYVVVKTATGDYLTDTMTIAEVQAIKARSETGKKDTGPWKTDFNEMAKKTVIKRAYKTWPKTDRLDAAVHHLNTDGGEGINFASERPNYCDPDVLKAWVDKAKAARTAESLAKIWQDGLAVIRPTKDMQTYEVFKQTVAVRGEEIKRRAEQRNNAQDVTPTEPAQREPGADDELEEDFRRQMEREQGGADANR